MRANPHSYKPSSWGFSFRGTLSHRGLTEWAQEACGSGGGSAAPVDHSAEDIAPVGHDPVDTEVEQTDHVAGMVDRPHVHLGACRVDAVHRPPRDEAQRAAPLGDLHGGELAERPA